MGGHHTNSLHVEHVPYWVFCCYTEAHLTIYLLPGLLRELWCGSMDWCLIQGLMSVHKPSGRSSLFAYLTFFFLSPFYTEVQTKRTIVWPQLERQMLYFKNRNHLFMRIFSISVPEQVLVGFFLSRPASVNSYQPDGAYMRHQYIELA